MERGKHITATVINDLVYDQRMIRICRTLSQRYKVCLTGRELSRSPELRDEPYGQKRITCFFQKGKLFYLEYNLRLFVFLLGIRTNAVLAVDLDTLPAAWLATRFSSRKLVYDAHEWFTEVPELEGRPIARGVWNWIGKMLVPRTDRAMTVNQSLANILSDIYEVPFEVVRNVPYRDRPGRGKTKHSLPPGTILYQGALNAGRGLDVAIKAMEQLPDKHLFLAGEGDLSQQLRHLAEKTDAGSRIHFAGRLKPEVLHQVTLDCWLGINLLSSSSRNYYYSLANKCFDYIQAGVPAINMDFPEYQRIHEAWQVGVLLHDLKVSAFVQAVRQFDEDGFYSDCVVACQKAASHYNWESESGKVLKIFAEL